MNLETLAVLLVIGVLAAILGRLLAGFSLSGCLVTYILACLGAVAGWVVQQQVFGPDNLLTLPLPDRPTSVSVVGASIGAFLLAFIGGLLSRPVARPSRSRYRR